MLKLELDRSEVFPHEVAVIAGYSEGFLLPASVIEHGERVDLVYENEGYISLCAYGFRGELGFVFRFLRAYLRCLRDAQDKLLRCEYIYSDGSMIFIRPADDKVRLVFGYAESGEPADNSYGQISRSLMPVLSELSGLNSIIGAKSAMSELAKKIKYRNPGYSEALMLIEQCERKWNIMQPPGL